MYDSILSCKACLPRPELPEHENKRPRRPFKISRCPDRAEGTAVAVRGEGLPACLKSSIHATELSPALVLGNTEVSVHAARGTSTWTVAFGGQHQRCLLDRSAELCLS